MYLWWDCNVGMVFVAVFHSGGGGFGMTLCKGSSFNISSSAIVKCTIYCEGGGKGGDEDGGGEGGGDGGDVRGGDGGGQEKNHYN